MTTLFADSVNPAAIPSTFTHVAAYANGKFLWPSNELDRFAKHIRIGVYPRRPDQARYARVLDVERYDASVSDFMAFARERHQLGHHDATAYCSLSLVGSLWEEMRGVDVPWRLWAAWYVPFQPSAASVLAELEGAFGVRLPASKLWAVQWDNGATFDTSVLYGADDFSRR